MHGGIHTPPGSRHPPRETATAADGTHPTGMHSCYFRGLFIDKFGFHFSGEKVDMKLDGGKDEESLGSVVRFVRPQIPCPYLRYKSHHTITKHMYSSRKGSFTLTECEGESDIAHC